MQLPVSGWKNGKNFVAIRGGITSKKKHKLSIKSIFDVKRKFSCVLIKGVYFWLCRRLIYLYRICDALIIIQRIFSQNNLAATLGKLMALTYNLLLISVSMRCNENLITK